jgi:predicted transcriptional regulator
MENKKLTITIDSDWKERLRQAARKGFASTSYVGHHLNFQTPAAFFGRLTEKRWEILRLLQGTGTVGVRELARRVDRDVRRVHDDVKVLVELGLVERQPSGSVVCPFADIHVDLHLRHALAA